MQAGQMNTPLHKQMRVMLRTHARSYILCATPAPGGNTRAVPDAPPITSSTVCDAVGDRCLGLGTALRRVGQRRLLLPAGTIATRCSSTMRFCTRW